MKHFIYIISLSILAGCSSYSYRPILYNNAKYNKLGNDVAEKHVDACIAKADKFLAGPKARALTQRLKRQATAGAILGGLIGVVSEGNLGGAAVGAGAGAAIGSADALVNEAAKDKLTPDQLKNRYITRCLNDEGFEIIGWM